MTSRRTAAGVLGVPAPAAAVPETMVIRPDTKWVNVSGGDIVKFVAGGKAFAWTFNVTSSVRFFELRRVAPPGMLDHLVLADVGLESEFPLKFGFPAWIKVLDNR